MGIDSSNFGPEAFMAPLYVPLRSDYDPQANSDVVDYKGAEGSDSIWALKPYTPHPEGDYHWNRRIAGVAGPLINQNLPDSTTPLSSRKVTVERPGTPTYEDVGRPVLFAQPQDDSDDDVEVDQFHEVRPLPAAAEIAKRTKGEDGENIPLQSTMSAVLETMNVQNPHITGNIAKGKEGAYKLQLYENAGRMYYKATLTFTIQSEIGAPITVEREIFTNTQNQKDAFVALQAYKEGMIDLFRERNHAFVAGQQGIIPHDWRDKTHVSIKLNRKPDHSVEAEKLSFGTDCSLNFIKHGKRDFAIQAGQERDIETALAPGAHAATLQLQIAENMAVLKQNMDKLKILNSLFKKKTIFRGFQNTPLFDTLRLKPLDSGVNQLQELGQLHSKMVEADRNLRAMVDLDSASRAQFASALSQIKKEMDLAKLILKELLPTQPATAQVPKSPEAPIDPGLLIDEELEPPLHFKEEDFDDEEGLNIDLSKVPNDDQQVDDSDKVVDQSILDE